MTKGLNYRGKKAEVVATLVAYLERLIKDDEVRWLYHYHDLIEVWYYYELVRHPLFIKGIASWSSTLFDSLFGITSHAVGCPKILRSDGIPHRLSPRSDYHNIIPNGLLIYSQANKKPRPDHPDSSTNDNNR